MKRDKRKDCYVTIVNNSRNIYINKIEGCSDFSFIEENDTIIISENYIKRENVQLKKEISNYDKILQKI